MPYKDKEKAREKRKKYYYEVEKPKIEQKKRELEKKKILKKIDRKKRENEARKYAWEIKEKNNCEICSEKDPACLVFHHIDPAKKRASIHKLYKYGLNAVKKEIKKCRLLCANCHMKYHYYEAGHGEGITISIDILEKTS